MFFVRSLKTACALEHYIFVCFSHVLFGFCFLVAFVFFLFFQDVFLFFVFLLITSCLYPKKGLQVFRIDLLYATLTSVLFFVLFLFLSVGFWYVFLV